MVFDKYHWAHMILTIEELAHALDFPSTYTAVMTDLDIERLTKVKVPRKVLALLVAGQCCLQWRDCCVRNNHDTFLSTELVGVSIALGNKHREYLY